MAYSSRRAREGAVSIARQTAAATENITDGEFKVLECEFEFSDEQEQEAFDLSSGTYGVQGAIAPGRSWGTCTLRGILQGAASDYDYTTDAIAGADDVYSPVLALIGAALGADSGSVASATDFHRHAHGQRLTYQNGGVNAPGSTTTVVKVADQSTCGSLGGMVAFRTDVNDVGSIGFVRELTNDVQDLCEVLHAMVTAPANADDQAPSLTYGLSDATPIPLTIRRLGAGSSFKWSLTGCVATALRIGVVPGKTPTWEVELTSLARTRYGSGGGSVAPAARFKPIKPIRGGNSGDLLINGVSTPGWHELSVEVGWEITPYESHAAGSGVAELVRRLGDDGVRVTATVPLLSSDSVSSGRGPWENAYENQTVYSLELRSGGAPGEQFGLLAAGMKLVEPPKTVNWNGYDAMELVFGMATPAVSGLLSPLAIGFA